jgi:hypothetical protein
MERAHAAKILQSLADGVDPDTGKAFPPQSPYQRADVVRALFAAIEALGAPVQDKPVAHDKPAQDKPMQDKAVADKEKKTSAPPSDKPGMENAGRPWSPEEDALLGQSFDAGKTIEVLASEHKRSRFAIEARLVKLGRIEDTSRALRFPMKKSAAAEPAAAYSARG